MKTYQIEILLANDVSYRAFATTDSREEAVDFVLSQKEAIDTIGENEILSINVTEETDSDSDDNMEDSTSSDIAEEEEAPQEEDFEGDYTIEETILPGCWLLTDLKDNVLIKFYEHHFEEQLLITDIEGNLIDPLSETAIAERAKKYLNLVHPELM